MAASKNFAWSFSQLSTYELCPKKYYHLYVAKDVKDSDSSFSADGKEIHDAMRWRVMDAKPLPVPMRHFEKYAAAFVKVPGEKHAEMKLAINTRYEPVGYFAPDVWCRANIDLAITNGELGIIVDWKTGKVKEDFTQIALSAALLSRWMPEVGLFKTMFVWLGAGEVTHKSYTISKLANFWAEILPRVQKMEAARKTTDFPAIEGGLCGYCPVTTCPHHRDR